jgi:hypothetical protein
MIQEGFDVKQDGQNAYFNFSMKSYEALKVFIDLRKNPFDLASYLDAGTKPKKKPKIKGIMLDSQQDN